MRSAFLFIIFCLLSISAFGGTIITGTIRKGEPLYSGNLPIKTNQLYHVGYMLSTMNYKVLHDETHFNEKYPNTYKHGHVIFLSGSIQIVSYSSKTDEFVANLHLDQAITISKLVKTKADNTLKANVYLENENDLLTHGKLNYNSDVAHYVDQYQQEITYKLQSKDLIITEMNDDKMIVITAARDIPVVITLPN